QPLRGEEDDGKGSGDNPDEAAQLGIPRRPQQAEPDGRRCDGKGDVDPEGEDERDEDARHYRHSVCNECAHDGWAPLRAASIVAILAVPASVAIASPSVRSMRPNL